MSARRPGGFTLVEVVAVVAIVGLLAGAVAVTFARPLRKARERQAMELIQGADGWARQQAKASGGEVSIIFDIGEGEVRREGVKVVVTRIPAGVRLAEVWTPTRRAGSGVLDIIVSPLGLSRTYAVRLVGPESDRWLVVAGFSGQFIEAADESEVADILRSASSRPEPR